MSKQYAVIGLGKFGFSVATTLAQAGKEVLAVDKDAEPVQEIADLVTYAARADITDSRVFASLGISNMDVVIVGISENMESSILATLQAKEAGVPLVEKDGYKLEVKEFTDYVQPNTATEDGEVDANSRSVFTFLSWLLSSCRSSKYFAIVSALMA